MSVVAGGTYDPADITVGPGRFVIAPITATVPTDPYSIVPAARNVTGHYPATTPWWDTGLSVDAPKFGRSTESSGLEFQQTSGVLFERVTDVKRQLTAQVAGFNAANIALIENVSDDAITEIATSAGKPAGTKITFGTFTRMLRYRGCLIWERADDSTPVTEPGGKTRPPAVFYVLPCMAMSADAETEIELAEGESPNVEVTFDAKPIPGAAIGAEHGFWWLEKPGSFVAGP